MPGKSLSANCNSKCYSDTGKCVCGLQHRSRRSAVRCRDWHDSGNTACLLTVLRTDALFRHSVVQTSLPSCAKCRTSNIDPQLSICCIRFIWTNVGFKMTVMFCSCVKRNNLMTRFKDTKLGWNFKWNGFLNAIHFCSELIMIRSWFI
jgi:hypothetical protein